MQLSAEISGQAIAALREFLTKASGTEKISDEQMANATFLVVQACDECKTSWAVSNWHLSQPVHAFEALTCTWAGQHKRWPPLSLNLHFTHKPDGQPFIATADELPLPKKYWTDRVIADAQFVSSGGG